MTRPTRILVIRFSSIGDIVLTTPVIRALAEQLDGPTEIHFLTKKKFAGILTSNPRITEVHTIEKTVQEVLPRLRDLDFDYVIDLHHNARSFFVKRGLKKLTFRVKKLNLAKWLLVRTGLNVLPARHVVDRYMETISAFGVQDDHKGLEYYIPEGEIFDRSTLPESHKQYIAWVIGGAHAGKRMSASKIAGIIRRTPAPFVLIGGPEDLAEAAIIESECPGVVNLTGKLSLHQSADCIRQADQVVTGDTGMMHIASAFERRIISLWGCTVPEFGMYPYRPHPASVILQPWRLRRRPCSKLGNRCKYGPPGTCINEIDDSRISEEILKFHT